MSKATEDQKLRHEAGTISDAEDLNAGGMKCYGESIAVCQKRKLVAAVLTKKSQDQHGYVTFFGYDPKSISFPSTTSLASTTTTSSATAASSSSSPSSNISSSSSVSSSLDYTFEKLASVPIEQTPWAIIFTERYLFICGEFENRLGFIDLEVATSESQEERKREAKLQFSSFELPTGYVCEYYFELIVNTSQTRLAMATLSFNSSGSIIKDFNGIVVLDLNNKFNENQVPEENAFPTISAIMDKHDEENQSVYGAELSKSDDGTQIAYISHNHLKICNVSSKEKVFDVEVEGVGPSNFFYCLFHPTEANAIFLAGGGKLRFYNVKAKTKIREFNLPGVEPRIRALCFPTIASNSRYLLASMYDTGITASEKNTNHRLDVIDTVDGTVIQSTSLPFQNATASSPGAFLSHNTMLFSDRDRGSFVLKGIAVCLWTSRKAVFLVREKSSSSNRVGDVLRNEWAVLVVVSKYVA